MTSKNRKINMFRTAGLIFFLTATLSIFSTEVEGQVENTVKWPEITSENKPGTYWWWMGSAVNKETLKSLLEQYYQAGLGGTKITPIYGAKDHVDEYIDFLTPKWVEMLAYTSKVSRELDMTVELASSTGWNMGGPWVNFEDASKRVVLKSYTLKSGQKMQEPIKYLQKPVYANLKEQPRQPLYLNSLLHREDMQRVRYQRELPLLTLMAYSDSGKIIDLTDKLEKYGELDWIAPSGEWSLYAVFLGTGGNTVERAAPGGVGWMIDYLSKDALMLQMNQFEEAFSQSGYEIHELIDAFHDDSFEQHTEFWTSNFFQKFEKLHGYDLRNQLPALFGQGPSEKVGRVKSDYRETVSHLIINEHTIPWRVWANKRGVKIINQAAEGSPAHPLDNWGASDQPENTGAFPRKLYSSNKIATSAGNVTGKKIISQETATIMSGHFHVSLADVKNDEIDKIFLNGVNKINYHSTTYSPEEAEWPGWLYYAPTHFVPTNTIWKDFPKLNSYVSRVSSFLQAGSPDNDLLLYYPIYDMWHTEDEGLNFHGFHLIQNVGELENTTTYLKDNGYAFDYISDRQILETTYRNGRLVTGGGNDYQALIFPSINYFPLKTLEYLIDLIEQGATIIFLDGLPKDVPGLKQLEERQLEFKKLKEKIEKIQKSENSHINIYINYKNTGEMLLRETNMPREPMKEEGLDFVRRSWENGHYYFIKNTNDFSINKFIMLGRNAESIGIYDPLTGTTGLAALRTNKQAKTEVYLQLQPGETCILQTFHQKAHGQEWKYLKELNDVQVIRNWEVSFTEGGPTIPPGFSTIEPKLWTEVELEENQWFAGTANYSTVLERPSNSAADEWLIDLGSVYHSAQIEVNGQHVATLITPPYKVNITNALQPGKNNLTVKITNLAANRIRYIEQGGIERPDFYNIHFSFGRYGGLGEALQWSVMKSGLEGPVRLIPAVKYNPNTN
jgi:hypothetical protein